MMKEEFDRIASYDLNMGICDGGIYEKEIEPTYMEFGDAFQITKYEMALMYYGLTWNDKSVWVELNNAYHENVARRKAQDEVKKAYHDAGLSVPNDIELAFQRSEASILRRVDTKLKTWRERSKKAA